jgi:CDP-paratose 2-epimerase
MKIFITGICGFVGATLAHRIREAAPDTELLGVDNLMRLGSESNRGSLITGSKFTTEIYEMRVI